MSHARSHESLKEDRPKMPEGPKRLPRNETQRMNSSSAGGEENAGFVHFRSNMYRISAG